MDREIKNKLIIRSLIGFVAGLIVGLIMWMSYNSGMVGAVGRFAFHEVMSGVLGLVANGSAVVYEIESWGIRRVTLTHYIICMVTFTIIGLVSGWFENTLALVIMLAIMTVVYAIIWLVECLFWKKTVRELNEELKNLHGDSEMTHDDVR